MLITRLRQLPNEKLRFVIGGCYNTAFGYALFALFYTWLHHSISYLLILAVAQTISVANGYLVHRWFTFRARGHVLTDGLRFSTVYLLTYAGNFVALPLLVDFGGIGPLVGQGLLVVLLAVFSYLAHRHFTFRRPTKIAVPLP